MKALHPGSLPSDRACSHVVHTLPHGGSRDETEFTYGRPLHITRSELTASDQEWTHYLYHRTNTEGPYRECWLRSFGCGRWFKVLRDTTTQEIFEIYLMG